MPITYAKEDNLVNIYLFHSKTCQHCQKEIKLLNELEKKYTNIKIYKYEINNDKNNQLFNQAINLLEAKVASIPFTIIGEKYFNGYSEEATKKTFIATIEYYSQNGYIDRIGEYLNDIPLPTYEINSNAIPIEEYIKDYGNYTFNLPIIGKINTKNLTIPLITVIMGLVDGFNPHTIWVLLFLITTLIGIKEPQKTFILGFTFILTTGIIYSLIMLLQLNLSNISKNLNWLKIPIGIIAIILGSYKIITNLTKKNRKPIPSILTLIGFIILTIITNIVGLTYSTNLSTTFTEILSLTNLSKIMKIFYILVYTFFFLLDDIFIFITIILILKLTKLTTKYKKTTIIIGGIILTIIGISLIFFPNIIPLKKI